MYLCLISTHELLLSAAIIVLAIFCNFHEGGLFDILWN